MTIDGELDTEDKVYADRIAFGELTSGTATLTYDFDGFTSISVPTVFGISVTQGPEYSIEVIIDEEAANRVEVAMDGRLAARRWPDRNARGTGHDAGARSHRPLGCRQREAV